MLKKLKPDEREEFNTRILNLSGKVDRLVHDLVQQGERYDKLKMEYDELKEKYALLLQKHIDMMERYVEETGG